MAAVAALLFLLYPLGPCPMIYMGDVLRR